MGLRFSYHQWAIFGGGRKHAGAKKGGIAKLDRISTDRGGTRSRIAPERGGVFNPKKRTGRGEEIDAMR